MRKRVAVTSSVIAGAVVAACVFTMVSYQGENADATQGAVVTLPTAKLEGELSVEEAIRRRRSVRSYSDDPITLQQVSQILWAGQGITDTARGFRTAPSAGALYPLEVYLVAGNVKGLQPAVYRYLPEQHSIELYMEGDQRKPLKGASLDQHMIQEAPASIVFTAIYERTTWKYRQRGYQYVHMDVGCAAENVYLQGVAIGIGTVYIGAFRDDDVSAVLELPDEEIPLCILPLGRTE